MIYPPYLSKGSTVGIVCPSGYLPVERVQKSVEILEQWGFLVKMGKTVGYKYHYFSGTDEERLADLQAMLDDPSIHAILCGRGGYGLSRIIDCINFSLFVQTPKWIIGFSDITVLHTHIYNQYKISTIHAAMAGAFADYGLKNASIQSLQNILLGNKMSYTINTHTSNRLGTAVGPLIGGNLSLLVHVIGTPSDMDYKDCILFIEDVGEYMYNIDRMLVQLKRNKKFNAIKGLIVGGFTDMKDTITPFGSTIYELIKMVVNEFDFPICFDFPVSHGEHNIALKYGTLCHLEIVNNSVLLKEL